MVKKTVLYDKHIEHGGKVIEFAGYYLPVQYQGIKAEHDAVRTKAGIFDVSHMGEVEIFGRDAERFINYLVTNDVTRIEENSIMYALMLYEDGGVVDDLLVYKRNAQSYLLVVNASNIEKDIEWIQSKAIGFDVSIQDKSETIGEVAIQGPLAQEIVSRSCDFDFDTLGFFKFVENIEVGGVKCLISRTGYTGEDGFEIYANDRDIIKVWEILLEKGSPLGLVPAGLGARDTLRFEAGLPLYGNEISQSITPLEAGLGFFVKLDKAEFIGKEALLKQKESGAPRKIIGLELNKGIPRHGYPVIAHDNTRIGEITTGYLSPTLGKNIALALVDSKYASEEAFNVEIRGKLYEAKPISKKFYTKNYKK